MIHLERAKTKAGQSRVRCNEREREKETHAVDPVLRVGLVSKDAPDVARFSVI